MGKRRKNKQGYKLDINKSGHKYWKPISNQINPGDFRTKMRQYNFYPRFPPQRTKAEIEEWGKIYSKLKEEVGYKHMNRDYQRSKVYKGEDPYINASERISEEEALELTQQICEVYGVSTPEVWTYEDMAILGEACDKVMILAKKNDTIPKGMVFHEMAHSISMTLQKDKQDSHGAVFVMHYLDMVSEFDNDNLDILKQGLESKNVVSDIATQVDAIRERAQKSKERSQKKKDSIGKTEQRFIIENEHGYWSTHYLSFSRSLYQVQTYSSAKRAESAIERLRNKYVRLAEQDIWTEEVSAVMTHFGWKVQE